MQTKNPSDEEIQLMQYGAVVKIFVDVMRTDPEKKEHCKKLISSILQKNSKNNSESSNQNFYGANT